METLVVLDARGLSGLLKVATEAPEGLLDDAIRKVGDEQLVERAIRGKRSSKRRFDGTRGTRAARLNGSKEYASGPTGFDAAHARQALPFLIPAAIRRFA